VENEAGELVAFGASVRSLSDAFRKTGGRLFPFGFIPTLRALSHGSEINLLLIAVAPAYQKSGVNAVVINQILENAWRVGIVSAETGPQLEVNANVLDQWKIFASRQHKRRRCFIKRIATEETLENANE
jgi:GNAT superfamily N-acetyltransferase